MKREILLIDDDSILNFIHSKIVSTYFPNIPIHVFKHAESGLEYIKNNPLHFYLIFLDINMPEMNGWEFLDSLSRLNKIKTQIHLLTSSIDKSDKIKAGKYKIIKSYLVKPLTKNVFNDVDMAKFSA